MASMKVSLDGLMAGVETSLRSSKSDHACMYAYSLMEFAENLRLVRSGECTIDELFALYTLAPKPAEDLKKRVDKRYYDCMRDEPEDDFEEAE